MNQDILNENLIKAANEVLKFLEMATPEDIQRELDSYSERVKLIVEEGGSTWDIEAVEIEFTNALPHRLVNERLFESVESERSFLESDSLAA